jgi:hypothetical protein
MIPYRTFLVTVVAMCCCTLAAAQSVDQLPGFFALEDLDVFAPGEVKVDVDLRDSMIKVAAGASVQHDENLATLLESVKRVRVKVGSSSTQSPAEIRATIETAASQLESQGWYRMVTLREGEETVFVMAREADNLIQGLTAMVHDGSDEVVLVNIAGDMDPDLIAMLIGNMDKLEDLDFDFGG